MNKTCDTSQRATNYDLYYLGYYAKPTLLPSRHAFSSAVSKMDYILSCLERLGVKTLLLSASPVSRGKSESEARIPLSKHADLLMFRSAGRHFKFDLPLQKIAGMAHVLTGLLSHVPKGSTLLVYHSLAYAPIIRIAKRIKQFKLIIEVEELYSDVTGKASDFRREKALFSVADGFVLSTELLANRVEVNDRPYVVCSGIYQIERTVAAKRDDGLVHIVYAGTLDPRKGGAAAAAAAGALLDESFAVHILGKGSSAEVSMMENAVREANSRSRGCRITYEGAKTGREFSEFVQSCHIGLSPQNPDADFNATSFPSKVFMYLANGLKVVSVDLPVFDGDLRKTLNLCSNNSPEDLACAIRSAAAEGSGSSSSLLEKLDKRFENDLHHLLVSV